MGWIIFVAGAVLSWGAYGALLHLGQTQLGNPLKALLCVGAAYFLIGVIIPVIALGGCERARPVDPDAEALTIDPTSQAARDGLNSIR